MLARSPIPFPKSIFDNIAYGPRLHGIRQRGDLDDAGKRSLKQVGLWNEVKDKLNSSALELSSGQKARLCIARAVAVQPEVLLIDDPATNLDPVSTAKIEDLIPRVEGALYHRCRHSQYAAGRSGFDHVAFLSQGSLVEFGPTSDVFARPKTNVLRIISPVGITRMNSSALMERGW